MSGAARSLSSRGPRWLSVLLCCLLSVTGPFNLSAVYQMFDSSLSNANPAGPCIEAQDIDDDEEDLLQPVNPSEGRRLERKQAAPDGTHFARHPSCSHHLHADSRLARRLLCLAGCEHAFRNGCGAPLRC